MENDDLLFDPILDAEPIFLTPDDYFKKTQQVLNNIASAYHAAWLSRPLKDEEFPEESICDKCKGCGTFGEGGDKECVQDRLEGWCYHRYFDKEQFSDEVEEITNGQVMELLSVEGLKQRVTE